MKEDRKTPEQRAAAKAARQAKLASMTPDERAAAKAKRQERLKALSPEEQAARRAKRQQAKAVDGVTPSAAEAPKTEAQLKKARHFEDQRAKKMQRNKKWQRAQQIADLPPAERRAISARMEERRLARLEREGGSSE